ncbi:MAG: efflux RND transporter periplasmic adaptor subunit [Balneolaceae bacterium]
MNFTYKQLLYGTGLLLAGLLLGWLLFSGSGGQVAQSDEVSPDEMDEHIQDTHTDEEGEVVYTCSMHPSVREDEPGNCPICGMELIPADEVDAEAEAEEDDYSMVMTAAAATLAQIQTAPVERQIPKRELRLPGRIKVDERNITNVTAHFPGRITDVKVDFTGAPIRKGEAMASIYSPELISAQRELFEAARQKERNPRLYESVRQKFRLWEFSDEQIDEIENNGEVKRELEIPAPVDGYVLSRNIADQQHVEEGSILYNVADLNRIWVVLEAYEEDIDWIDTGDTLTFSSRTNPGETYEAAVSYIDPVVDPDTRTVGIRADINNPGQRMKPDMLVSATLQAEMDEEKLLVPASSVLWTGKRSLVYVQDTSSDVPRFEVREVTLGVQSGDYYVIEDGVEEGEEVVFHGNFRVDSEFQLADRFSMMNREPGGGAAPAHDHGDMDMEMDEEEMEESPSSSGDSTENHSEHTDQRSEVNTPDAGDTPEEFRAQLQSALQRYMDLKDALVNSDPEQASHEARALVDEMDDIDMTLLEGEAHDRWMELQEAMNEHTGIIAEAEDLEAQRDSFFPLSERLVDVVREFGVEGVVYYQYCPMAFGGDGAYWLSEEEEIHNPYQGEEMLNCGEIIDEIEF